MSVKENRERRRNERRAIERRNDPGRKLPPPTSMMQELLFSTMSDAEVEAWIDRAHEAHNAMWRARGWTPAIYE